MKNEHQRAALLCSGCRKVHRRSARYDHRRATRTPDLLTLGSFQTGLARLRVPSLRSRVRMRRRDHPRRKDRLHVLSGIGLTGDNRKRPDFGNAFAPGRSPALTCNRQQPRFSKRLHDDTAGSFCYFRLGSGGVNIKMPKGLRLGELPDRLTGDDLTPHFACTLSNWLANLGRR